MPTDTQTRHQKRIAALRARKVSLMNNSKWARLFDTLWRSAGLQYAQAKPLTSDQLYEIEYIIIPLPETICRQTLAAALAKSGQYETEWLADSLKVYGYR